MATVTNTRDVILRVASPRYVNDIYQTQIAAINNTLADIADDSKLTAAERQALRKEWDQIIAKYVDNSNQGLAYLDTLYPAVTSYYTAYQAALQTLATYLNNGSAYTLPSLGSNPTDGPSWISNANLTATAAQTIVGTTFRANWKAVYTAETVLVNKATDEAGKVAIFVDGGGNLLKNSSFEVDSDSNGLADNWTAYSNGTTGTVSYSRISSNAIHGTYKQRFSGSGLGTSSSDRVGAYQQVTAIENKVYVLSVWHGNNTGAPVIRIYIDWFNASSTFISSNSQTFSTSGTMTRSYITATAPATTAIARIYLFIEANGVGPGLATIDIDAVQFQLGNALTGYAPREDDLLAGTVNTTHIVTGAVTQNIRTDYADSWLYSSSATASTTVYRSGPDITTSSSGRVLASSTGRVAVYLNTTSNRYLTCWLKLQLVDKSSGTIVDETGIIASSTLAVVDNVLSNSVALFAVPISVLFDAVSADEYTVRLYINISCYWAGNSQANITDIQHSGEFSVVELKV